MTLIMIEGFETRVPKNGWGQQSPSYTTGRFGGTCINSGGGPLYTMPTPTDVVVLGEAIMLNAVPSSRALHGFYDSASGNPQMSTRIRADRYLEIGRGGNFTPILGTSPTPIGNAGEWVYVEHKVRLNDVTGFYEVRVNGVVVATYSGDTVATTGTNSGITMIEFGMNSGSSTDDVYLLNNIGPAPFNDYLGEISVETLIPNGNGVTNQFVGSDGNSVDNYLLVDELPAVDTDHAASSTSGQRDLYTFTDPTAGIGEILAVQANVAASKTIPGPATVKIVERLSSGVERVSPARNVTNLLWRCEINTTDPSGAAWTPTAVQNMQFGAEVG